MDQPSPDPELLGESLDDLVWFNRYLGGTATVLHQLERLLRGYPGKRLRVLDVGAGAGDIAMALQGWCANRGLDPRAVALERGRHTVRLMRDWLDRQESRTTIRIVRGDARSLPFAGRSFDVSFCSTFLHHLEPDDAARALAEMARVSRWGLVVCDLRRTWPGYLAARTLAVTVWRRHAYARHDGPLSVRAAYTPREARELAGRAGLDARVEPQPFFRWGLRWRRETA